MVGSTSGMIGSLKGKLIREDFAPAVVTSGALCNTCCRSVRLSVRQSVRRELRAHSRTDKITSVVVVAQSVGGDTWTQRSLRMRHKPPTP